MFSGCIPFAGKAEYHVIIAVSQGRRPERPMQSIARDRGLTDQIWEIIVTCWNQNPDKRLTAAEVVQCLRTLPNLPPDNRPADSFSMPPPSSATYEHAQNPFSILGVISEQAPSNQSLVPGPISQMQLPYSRRSNSI